jgi:hypothetical protein
MLMLKLIIIIIIIIATIMRVLYARYYSRSHTCHNTESSEHLYNLGIISIAIGEIKVMNT